jgi:hypothetical protein
MTQKASRPRPPKRSKKTPERQDSKASHLPDPIRQRIGDISHDEINIITSTSLIARHTGTACKGSYPVTNQNIKWPSISRSMYKQSTAGEIPDRLLISQLIEVTRPQAAHGFRTSWIYMHPEFLSSIRSPALRCSIRAATTACHGLVHRDIKAQTDSCRWYIEGIERHRAYLRMSQGVVESSEDKSGTTPEDILVPLFLCFFEVYACTTPEACFQHLRAAVHALALRGPDQCREGMLSWLFRSFRVSDSGIAIFTGTPSVFAAPEWRAIPFEGGKPPLQRLVDIMLFIPVCLSLSGQERPLLQHLQALASTGSYHIEVQERCMQLLEQLGEWRTQCERVGRSLVGARKSSDMDIDNPNFVFRNTYTALTVSIYNATAVVLHSILHALSMHGSSISSDNPSEASHIDQISRNCASILRISKIHEDRCPVGFDIMRGVFPLKTVAMLSVDSEQRAESELMIRKWGSDLGLGGLLRAQIGL